MAFREVIKHPQFLMVILQYCLSIGENEIFRTFKSLVFQKFRYKSALTERIVSKVQRTRQFSIQLGPIFDYALLVVHHRQNNHFQTVGVR